jgi:hypothetical protein
MREARRLGKLRHGHVWRRALRGGQSLTRVRSVASATLRRALQAPARRRERLRAARAGGDELDVTLDRLRAGGKRIVLVFSGGEPLYEELRLEGRLERLDRWPDLRVEVVSDPPEMHTLRPPWLQERVHAVLDRELEDLLSPAPTSASASDEGVAAGR